MTPLPASLGGTGALLAWRLDMAKFATTWDSGEGSRLFGGRWNSKGRRVVYCSVDPATSILEVAVHKRFEILDTVPHVLTAALIRDVSAVRVVEPGEVPNPDWLRPGAPSAGQSAFGDNLLSAHPFVLIPSVVSSHSWNVLFDMDVAKGMYLMQTQEAFVLD
ncbi:MAG: RES domain-containing protein, partial [Betaproteobacteria bacterium]